MRRLPWRDSKPLALPLLTFAADRELARLAQRLNQQTCARQGIAPSALTIHVDGGPGMIAESVALSLADLGVTRTH